MLQIKDIYPGLIAIMKECEFCCETYVEIFSINKKTGVITVKDMDGVLHEVREEDLSPAH